jgi:hypothetical protein
MNILTKAIAHEGGLCNLAKSLRLSSSRVGNWQHESRGTPEAWVIVLNSRYGHLPDIPALERKRRLARQAVVSGAESGCE